MLVRLVMLYTQFVMYLVVLNNLTAEYYYAKYVFQTPDIVPLLGSALVLAAMAVLLPSAIRRPSDAVLWMLGSLVVVPVLVVGVADPVYAPEVRLTSSIIVVLGFFVLALGVRGPRNGFKTAAFTLDRDLYTKLLLIVIVVGAFVVIAGYGFSGFDLGFDNIYDRRLSLRTVEGPFPGSDYVMEWMSAPVIPLALAAGFYWKRPVLIAGGLFVAAVLFSLGGQKGTALIGALVAVLVFAFDRGVRGDRRTWFGAAITFALSAPVILSLINPSSSLAYLFTRRVGLLPALLTNEYVVYANNRGFTSFSQYLDKYLTNEAPTRSMGFVIGAQYGGGAADNANVHLWADGYVSLGFAGVVLVTGLLILVLRWSDRLAASRDAIVASAAIAATLQGLTNGSMITSLWSGGLVVTLAFVWLLPRPRDASAEADSTSRGGAIGAAPPTERGVTLPLSPG